MARGVSSSSLSSSSSSTTTTTRVMMILSLVVMVCSALQVAHASLRPSFKRGGHTTRLHRHTKPARQRPSLLFLRRTTTTTTTTTNTNGDDGERMGTTTHSSSTTTSSHSMVVPHSTAELEPPWHATAIAFWERSYEKLHVYQVCCADSNAVLLLCSFLCSSKNLIPSFSICVGSICAGLTSSVTVGFVYGLVKGKRFGHLTSIRDKIDMLNGNYRLSVVCMLGLAACGLNGIRSLLSPMVLAGIIAMVSGVMASTVALQFYQFPNLLSTSLFPQSSSISLSLTDAVGCFATAQLFALNSRVIGHFGWSASWMFLAAIFGIGGRMMMNAIPNVLYTAENNQ